MDDFLRCKRFSGFCDDFDSTEDLSGMYRGKSFNFEEFEDFVDRFNQNTLQTDEQISYNMWTSDPENPDPGGFEFDECPTHRTLLLRILYGKVLSDRNTYYCFENCEFGTILQKTNPSNHYLQIIYSYLSGCSEIFSLYGDKDILKFMEQEGMYFSSTEEQEEELFFVKQCITSFTSGQSKGYSDNRKKDEENRKEENKQTKK